MTYGWRKGDKSNPAELSLCLMSIMPPQHIAQVLARCSSCSAAVVTHQSQGELSVMSCCFQLRGEAWLLPRLAFIKLQNRGTAPRTAQQFRRQIERSKVQCMHNVKDEEGGWLWVSEWRTRHYHVLWRISYQREAELSAAQRHCMFHLNWCLINSAVNKRSKLSPRASVLMISLNAFY